MQKRPIKNSAENFINFAEEKINLHSFRKWPFHSINNQEDSSARLSRSFCLPLTESEWNDLDKHTKYIGIPKTKWVRFAIKKLIQEEKNIIF